MDWNKIPSKGSYPMYMGTLGKLITPKNYGRGPDKWNLTEILRQPDIVRVPALNTITGDDVKGNPRPDRAMKLNGIPFMFKLRVMTRQIRFGSTVGCISVDGKKICVTDDEYSFHSDGVDEEDKILVEYRDKPKPGDVVRWKDRMREPDNVIDQQTIMSAQNEPLITAELLEPHLSTEHIDSWAAAGEDLYIYEEYEVDENLCINVPIAHAQAMLRKFGHRIARPQWRKMDKPKPEEKPPRKITNWLFQEAIPQTKERGKKNVNKGTN